MDKSSRRRVVFAGIALAAAWPLSGFAQSKPDRNRVVFQVTESDAAKWTMVLNNMKNLQAETGGESANEIELVVYGPAIVMLKSESPAAARISEAMAHGVKVAACENSMKNMKLEHADMQDGIGYVSAGVVEVMRKQQQGWVYIRP